MSYDVNTFLAHNWFPNLKSDFNDHFFALKGFHNIFPTLINFDYDFIIFDNPQTLGCDIHENHIDLACSSNRIYFHANV